MWLDQDLLKLSEEQRRGAAASTTTVTARRSLTATLSGSENLQPGTGSHNPGAGLAAGFEVSEGVAATDRGAQAHGYAKGFAAGWAAGQRRAAREALAEKARADEELRMANEANAEAFADAMESVRLLAEAVTSRDELVAETMRNALADAAIELAEALLGAELADGPSRAKSALRRALNQCDPKDVVAVRMHPRDIEQLDARQIDALMRSLPAGGASRVISAGPAQDPGMGSEGPAPIELIADSDLAPGDAVVQMPEGFLDARLSSALLRAKHSLAQLREVGGEL